MCGHCRSALFGKLFLWSGDMANEDTDKLVIVELFCAGDFFGASNLFIFSRSYDLMK